MRIDELSGNEIKELVKETYIFTYPLVMQYYTMYKHSLDPKSIEFTGGFGKFLHYGLVKPGDMDIVAPNNDTPYSITWVDTRSEPWVLVMPPVEPDRYFSAQISDLWGFVPDNAGCIHDGNNGGAYLLAPLSWKGELPKGVKRAIQGDTPFMWCNIRTQVFEEAEFPRVREIQNQCKMMPLHEFLGTPAPAPAPRIDWPPITHGDEAKNDMFKYVNFLLQFTTPHPFDKENLEKAARLGIGPGLEWKPETFSKQSQQALREGIDAAIAEIDAAAKIPSPSGERFNTRQNMGKRFLHRAIGVYAGLGGNTSDQAVYRRWFRDEKNEFLDGSRHSYKLTFRKDQIPNTKFFWSLTMYSMPDRYLVPNTADRYSIGSRAFKTLKLNPDGGFDIYIGKESPNKEFQSNWLPAPNGPFTVTFRIFGPDEKMMAGDYDEPIIKVIQ